MLFRSRWEQKWPNTFQCNKCDNYAHVEQPKLTMPENAGYSLADIKPNYMLTFYNADQKNVGTFDFNEGKMHFEGDVTESGRVFVDWIVNCFKQRLDDAVKEERRACKEIADRWVKAYPHPSQIISQDIEFRGL